MKEDIEYIFNTLNEMKIEDSEKFISTVSNMFFDYQKLKRENQMLKNTKNTCPHLSTSGVSCNIKEHYIEKDKIREKLDYYTMSLKDDDFADDEDYNKMKYGIQVLKELLEEE